MESSTDTEAEPSTATQIADVVCTRCGCLCDDVVIHLSEGKPTQAVNACAKGLDWFLSPPLVDDDPVCTIQGKPATLEEGIEAAATILLAAKRPLVDGLARTTVEAEQHAVEIAQAAKGIIIGTASAAQSRHSRAARAVGAVSATWGELRNRADIILVWNSNPVETHPRHFERYSLEPVGRFIPGGRSDRTLIVLSHEKTATSALADYSVTFKTGRDFEVATVLRALLKNIILDADHVLQSTGIALETWAELVSTMKRAHYGAILHDPGTHPLDEVEHASRAIMELVTDLNSHTCFAYSPLGDSENAAGAEQVVAWKSVLSGTVDFSGEFPRSSPYEETTEDILRDRSIDAALLINSDPLSELEPTVWQWLGYVPTIALSPLTTATSESATVSFRTAEFGRSTTGSVFRADGVALPLRPIEPSPYPSDEKILGLLADKLTKREG